MSKKRTKSPANNVNNNIKWESNIVTADLNGENWSYSLVFLIENIPEDTETINYINKGISSGLRRRFTCITKEKILELINEFGNPKAKKGKEAPLNFEICEIGKVSLDKGEALSAQYLAKFIKWIMLTNKTEDLKSIGDTNKKSDGKTSKAKKGTDKAEKPKPASGKKGAPAGGKRSPEPPSVKQEKKLRKRGDPDPDIEYIDDEPDDGSYRYFIVSGMVDPQLLEALTEIGCIATSVVKVSRDIHIPVEESDKNNESRDKTSEPSKEIENSDNKYEKDVECLNSFWSTLNMILNNNKQLSNTPIVTLIAKHLMFPINKDDEESKNKCSMELFECLAVLIYDLLDLKRQWLNYLSKSKLILLPVKAKTSTNDENTPRESVKEGTPLANSNVESNADITFDNLDMDYYKYLMQDIPVESTSVYLQMSAMLDQVEITCGEKTSDYNKPKTNLPNGLNEDTAEILRSITDNLYLPKDELVDLKNSLNISNDDFDKNKLAEQNTSIHALDYITLRDREINSKHFGSNGIIKHELQMLLASFRHFDLLNVIPVDDKIGRKRAARLQQLLNYLSVTGLSNAEINYAIKIFIVENLILSGVDENGFIRTNNEDGLFQNSFYQVWDDPFMIINEVAQTIMEEEMTLLKKEHGNTEKNNSPLIHSETTSSSLKSDTHTEGILKSSRHSSRSQSPENLPSLIRKSSVHFVETDIEESQPMLTETQLDIMNMLDDEENETFQNMLLDYLQSIKKRNFSEWCFEEFYEPHVLLQIIHNAVYKYPYVDIYNQRRVNGKIVVLHNPFHPDSKLNQQPWNQWLHSNVGFRNYLDFVTDKIEDWTRNEEAIYQANLLSKEIQTMKSETKEPEIKEKPTKANDKSKKPKQTKSRSRSSSRASSVEDTSNLELNLILPGSLKAQKLEQDKINRAKEEEELKKEQKRQLSAQKKTDKEMAKTLEKGKDNKRPSSKASNKSKTKKAAFEELGDSLDKDHILDSELDKADSGEFWPFISYNLGNDLAHLSGNVAHLFPSDGSTIRIFKMQKLLGMTSVRVSVITTQLHVFSIHIIDPTYAPEEITDYDKILEEFQNQKNISTYGASTCTFSDGLTIVASNKGFNGTFIKNEPSCPSQEIQSDEIISQRSNDQIPSGNLSGSNQAINCEPNDIKRKGSYRTNQLKDSMDVPNIPNIILSTPNGVQVTVGYELIDEKEKLFWPLLYMSKRDTTINQTPSPEIPKSPATETGRYITSNGLVVSIFNNDEIKVLFADGSLAVSRLTTEINTAREDEPDESKVEKSNPKESPTQKKKTKQSKSLTAESNLLNCTAPIDEVKTTINYFRKWTVTLSNGEMFEAEADLNSLFLPKPLKEITNEAEPVNELPKDTSEISEISEVKSYFKSQKAKEPLLVSSATDPSSRETLVTRSDGTLLLVSQDAGIFLSEHFDGTRFTKHYHIEKSSNSKNSADCDDPKPQITELLLIESKYYPSITVDLSNRKIETRLGSMGSLLSDSSGYHLFKHSDNTEIEYRPDGEIIFTASQNAQMTYLQPGGPCSYVFNAASNIVCEILDNEGTEFIVDVNGDYFIKTNAKNEKSNTETKEEQEPDQEANQETDQLRQSNSAISMCNDNNIHIRKYDQHAPRIFTINSNGSGSELLRYRDIVDTLVNAEINDDHFHYREEVQDFPQIVAHTVLHPDIPNKPWQYEYYRKTVLPKGLTCRDLKSFPNKENPIKGPEFAIGVGRGLQINMHPNRSEQNKKETKNFRQDLWTNPMQFRQFLHYPVISNDIKNNFELQLIEYNRKILQQKQNYKDLEIVDDRNEDEVNVANEIKKRFEMLNYHDKQILNHAINCLSQSNQQKKKYYEEENKQNKLDFNKKQNENQRKLDLILEQEKINKEKELENKISLKNKIVPKYFTSIYGKDFISNHAMDLQSLNKAMKLFPMSRDGTGVYEGEKRCEESKQFNDDLDLPKTYQSRVSSKAIVNNSNQDLNDINYDVEERQDSKLVIKKKEKKYLYYDSSLILPDVQKRIPVSSNLSLPNYLYSQRPAIEPNLRQAIIEDPVRRKVYTTSLIGGSKMSQINQRKTRGLNVLPARLDTGLLREGENYIFKIKLINTGPESSYFKVKQPPSSSGIWMEFLPGPIAAGLSRTINIHIYAIASSLENSESGTSFIEQHLEIITDTDRIAIPIIGRVMTADKYDSIYPISNNDLKRFSTVSELLPTQFSNSPIVS